MASHGYFSVLVHAFVFASLATSAFSQLSPNYYDYACPNALSTIKSVVEAAVQKEYRMGASLLRLHFHDCFVNGCDGSILLDPSPTIDSEKNAFANFQSVRGFEVVDDIKQAVDEACGTPVVSCADILAVAARDSVVALGGPTWEVQLGRRDSTTASKEAADANIPAPFFSLSQLITNFKNHGLDEKDLVVLSGGHTIGYARCVTFKDHIYNDSNIDPNFAQYLKYICPRNGGDLNLAPLDSTAANFDLNYYSNLVQKNGLLHSDQELFNGGSTDELVKQYSYDTEAFYVEFANSMVKMGNIQPLTGDQGEIRVSFALVSVDACSLEAVIRSRSLAVLQAPWSCGYPSGPFCIGLLMRYVANNHCGHSHLHDSHHSHCHDSLSSHFHDAWLLQLLTYASLLLPSPLTAVNVAAMDSDGDNRTGDDHHRGATTIMEVEVATTMTIGENCRYCQLVTKTGNSRNQPRDG
ncbi:hypothetical protein JHK85_006441 [Glycine max]|nr:hypothetical protein JHK85_006441 [Glycine max]